MPIVKCRRGVCFAELVEHRLDHGRRELLRRQPVTSRDDARLRREGRPAIAACLGQRGDHVEVQRIAGRAGLLGPVEHGQAARARRQGGQEGRLREGPVQPDLQHAHLFAARDQVVDGLVRGLRARAHDDDHALGLRVAGVLEQPDTGGRSASRTRPSRSRRCPGRRRRRGWRPRAPGRRRRGSARSRGGPADRASGPAAGGPERPARSGGCADRRRSASSSSRLRATCGSRRRNAGRAPATRGWRRVPPPPCRGLPGPSSSTAARTPSAGTP